MGSRGTAMSDRDEDETLYECDCFRVVRFTDDEGQVQVCITFNANGIDLYMPEEEFGHFVEAMGGIDAPPAKSFH